MNSPVLRILSSYIKINRQEPTSLYVQIAHGIINAIHTKAIPTGQKLPGTRILAEQLYIHRKTAIAAYEELAAQGWIDIIPQKGAYVSTKKLKSKTVNFKEPFEVPKIAAFSVENNFILDSPFKNINTELFFTEGTPDYRLIPTKEINRIFNAVGLKRSSNRILNKTFYVENDNLKNQLINYIHITKSISINSEQLLLCNSNQIAIQTIIQTLFKPNERAIIFEPGNFATHMLFKNAGIQMLPINTRDQYHILETLESILTAQKIRAIYFSSSYATEQMWNEVQKERVLQLAAQHKCIILEDDNASDFIYSKNTPTTFKKLDKLGCVVYLNSLKDILPSPYNLAYIIAPNNVINELTKVKNNLQSPSNYLIEETIAEYISEGFLLRQVQKNTKSYLKRRENFTRLLEQYFEQSIQFTMPEKGLAYWITFNHKLPLLTVAKSCEKSGLTLPAYLLFQTQDLTGIRLGFGHLTEPEAEKCLAIFNQSVYSIIYK